MTIADIWASVLDDPRLDAAQPSADIRPSSFPFCSRRYGWRHLIAPEPDDFFVRSETYTGIGRAVHDVAQRALIRRGVLSRCEEELRDDDIGLVGHIDGVLDDGKPTARVFELKTSAHAKVLAMRRKSAEGRELAFFHDAPWYGYRQQALTYAALLGLDAAEIFILSRDSPSTCVSVVLGGAQAFYTEHKRHIHRARHDVGLRILPEPDAGPACTYCPHRDACETPPLPDDVTDAGVW